MFIGPETEKESEGGGRGGNRRREKTFPIRNMHNVYIFLIALLWRTYFCIMCISSVPKLKPAATKKIENCEENIYQALSLVQQ